MPGQYVQQGPPFSYFTSQINPYDYTGHNNCGQASLITCALAAGAADNTKSWQSLIDEACMATRGTPDSQYNSYTSFSQLEDGFRHWQLDFFLTYDWNQVYNAPWSLLLVDGNGITLADGSLWYDPSYFGYEYGVPNHFVVYGPRYAGAGDWCMNPLSVYPGDSWAHADVESLRRSFGGGYVLPGLPTSDPDPPDDPEDLEPAYCRMNRDAGLKPVPASGGPNAWDLKEGDRCYDYGVRKADQSKPPDPDLRWANLGYSPNPQAGSWVSGWVPGNKKYFTRET